MQINQIPTPPLGSYFDNFNTSATNSTNMQMPNINIPNNTFLGMSMGTLQGIGTLASILGGLWSASRQADYQDKLYKEEKRRIAREEKRQDAFENSMKKVYR